MTVVLDASVALRWFVDQPGHEAAAWWLRRFQSEPDLFVAPDLLRFEVHGGLARLQPPREPDWAARCFGRLERLGVRTLPTTMDLFRRALALSRELRVGGYDAIYLAHAESLGARWLTADGRILRRLRGDPRVLALDSASSSRVIGLTQ
jgi:predicted nucleic acid-binding protein